MAHRAQEAGYTALCLTLDSTVRAKRERNIRNNYSSPPSPNYAGLEVPEYAWQTSSDAPRGVNTLIDRAATWPYVDWLAAHTPLPLVVKGIMTAEDARLCAEHGVRAIIVSNHGPGNWTPPSPVSRSAGGRRGGGREVRGLPRWRHSAGHGCAESAGAGRPRRAHWAPAVLGPGGGWGGRCAAVLRMLRDELEMAMGMCGRPTIASIDRSLLGTVSPLLSVLQPPPGLQIPPCSAVGEGRVRGPSPCLALSTSRVTHGTLSPP